MSFCDRCDHVFFCRVNFYGPSVGKVTFLIGQFPLPISRIVPTGVKLRPSPRTPVNTRNCYYRQVRSCQEKRPISHIFVPVIGDRSRGGIRKGIYPWMTKQLNHLCWQTPAGIPWWNPDEFLALTGGFILSSHDFYGLLPSLFEMTTYTTKFWNDFWLKTK